MRFISSQLLHPTSPTHISSVPGRATRVCRKGLRSPWAMMRRALGLGLEMSGLSGSAAPRSEEHTSELQSRQYLVCRLLLEKKKIQALRLPSMSYITRDDT